MGGKGTLPCTEEGQEGFTLALKVMARLSYQEKLSEPENRRCRKKLRGEKHRKGGGNRL